MAKGAPVGNKYAKGHGRPKGTPNKVTTQVKEMILAALDDAGGQKYLAKQAEKNAPAFMALLAKILPRDVVVEADVNTTVSNMSTEEMRDRARELQSRLAALGILAPVGAITEEDL